MGKEVVGMNKSGLKIVIVNGAPGCGKTSFENFCRDKMDSYCQMRSTVDLVKEIALIYANWDGKKNLKSRKFLSDLKDLLTEFNDIPFKDIVRFKDVWEDELDMYGVKERPHILLVDSREPEEIMRFKRELGAITVLIRRADAEKEKTSNHADANVLNCEYDYEIDNNGSLDDLRIKAAEFLDLIFDKI